MSHGQSQYKRFVFTAPLTVGGHDVVRQAIRTMGFTKFCFQHETGEDGYEHYQGRVSGRKALRMSELLNRAKAKGDPVTQIHWEIEINARGSEMYVTKDQGRVAGPWKDTDPLPPYIPHKFRTMELWRWQRSVVDRLERQDDRKFLFLVDKKGGHGKSALGMYMSLHHGAIRIPSSIRTAEDMSAVVLAKVGKDPHLVRTIILDIPRSVVTSDHWGKWIAALEEIKNGHVYDKRYAYREVFFEPPKILVTSNSSPPPWLLTADRIDIVDILWLLFSCGEMDRSEYDKAMRDQRAHDQVWKEKRRRLVTDDLQTEEAASAAPNAASSIPDRDSVSELSSLVHCAAAQYPE